MQLAGQRAIVAGAGRGLNTGIARALATAGAQVCVADTDIAAAEALAQAIGAQSAALDPANATSVAALCDIAGDWGVPDILVMPNATLSVTNRAEEMPEGAFDAQMTTVQRPLYLLCRAFLPAMRVKGAGLIVVPLARNGAAARPPNPWAAATEAWLTGAVRALAVDLAPSRIRVNGLLAALDDAPALPRFLGGGNGAAARATPPLGHFPAQAEFGQMVVFLASDAGQSITGQMLAVDGGRGL